MWCMQSSVSVLMWVFCGFSPQIIETSKRNNAPRVMNRGSAVIDSSSRYIYVSPYNSSEVYKYMIQQDKWIQQQNCPYENSGLVIMNNYLISVGGHTSRYVRTNKLFKLQGKKWEGHFPSMNTARSHSALTTLLHHLIVIGGYFQYDDPIASVEVLNAQTNKWSFFARFTSSTSLSFSHTLWGTTLYSIRRH